MFERVHLELQLRMRPRLDPHLEQREHWDQGRHLGRAAQVPWAVADDAVG